ncbi:MAG: glycosyltransferase [bacterium]
MERKTRDGEKRDVAGNKIEHINRTENIVYIARFEPWKRHAFLLKSLAPILKGNVRLYLLGDGSIRNNIEHLVERLGVGDNVIFTGNVDRSTVHSILGNARLAVTVSPSETFGWCLLEPYCMDVPLVTTNVGIAGEIVQDYRNGFVLHPKCSKKEFCEKVVLALKLFDKVDNSPAKQLYTWDNFGRNMARCYESLMSMPQP